MSISLVTTKHGLEQNRTHTSGWSSGTTTTHSSSVSHSKTAGVSESIQKRPLLTPDEVGRLFGDQTNPKLLAVISGHQPLALRRGLYFQEERFEGLFGPHPDHKPPPRLPILRAYQTLRAAQRRAAEQIRQEEERRRAEEAERRRLEEQRKREAAGREKRRQQLEAARLAALEAERRRKLQLLTKVAIWALLGGYVLFQIMKRAALL
jgi:hypothetical protein